MLHGDARELELAGSFDAVVTSPPYPGLIDYHEQHRYAYELLGLDDLRAREIGAAASGTSQAAMAAYTDGITAVLASCAAALKPRGRVVVVVNDRRELYPEILERAGLSLEQRYQRHVNRRTGRRAGEYFEDVLVARRLTRVSAAFALARARRTREPRSSTTRCCTTRTAASAASTSRGVGDAPSSAPLPWSAPSVSICMVANPPCCGTVVCHGHLVDANHRGQRPGCIGGRWTPTTISCQPGVV